MKAALKKAARDAVEVIEVAKASLDHGEQMLAIFCQKALRLASIEGCKPFGQQPPFLRLIIVRLWAMRWISTRPWSPPTVTQSHQHRVSTRGA